VPPPTITTLVSAGVNNISISPKSVKVDYKSTYNVSIISIKK